MLGQNSVIGLFIVCSISILEKGVKIVNRNKYLFVFGNVQVLE